MLYRKFNAAGLLPALPPAAGTEPWRSSFGAGIGIAMTALLALLVTPFWGPSPALIAPLGATAVLVFAVPNAPLAQPWSAIIGNMLSAFVTVLVLTFYSGTWAPALAVGLAILVMAFARALHPPGGAVALLASIDPGPILETGFLFAVFPVGAMTAVLVAVAVFYNRITGRTYPFRHAGEKPTPLEAPRLALSNEDLADLLRTYRQSANIGVADLGRLLAAAEREAADHRFDNTSCADVMTPDLISVTPDQELGDIARIFRRHRIKSLPVIGHAGVFMGVILQSDLIEALAHTWPRSIVKGADRKTTAGHLARPANPPVRGDTPIGQVLNHLARDGVEMVPVVEDSKLVGIITRSDVMRLLLEGATKDKQV